MSLMAFTHVLNGRINDESILNWYINDNMLLMAFTPT